MSSYPPGMTLEQIFRHNHWANGLVTAACLDLTPQQLSTSVEGTYGELGRTLAHLAAGEAGYTWRLDQSFDRFRWNDETDPVPSVNELAAVLDRTGRRLIELAGSIPGDREISYEVEGETRSWRAWVILGQVIDHGREHRSHVATILTQLGIQPPDMDMWAYGESTGAGP